jgi:hypothetical protein
MADLTQQLAQMGSLLNINGIPSFAQPGQQIVASLSPALTVLHFTEIVQEDISLDFIAKDVVFTNKNILDPAFVEDPAIAKILPLFNLTAIPPTIDNSGVPGLIGKLKGKIPVAIPSEAAPTLTVNWKIQDDNGNDLIDGTDFLAPAGLGNTTLDVVFLPAFTLFDGTVPPPVGRNIIAVVTLTAGADSWNGNIGPVRVLIPAVPFPKVLALTVDTDFQGPALIIVPGASAITSIEHIRTLLQPVRNVIGTLTSVVRLAEMLIGIDTLSGILDATNIVFSKADSIGNLNDITLVSRPWYENDTEAEDELSAFVYIAPPPPPETTENEVECYNDRHLKTGEGKFTVNTGTSFVALCRDLHSATPSVIPASAVLTVNNAPDGWRWAHSITSFGDELSSIKFL